MAISTGIRLSNGSSLLGVGVNLSTATTADQLITLNTGGRSWTCGQEGGTSGIFWINPPATTVGSAFNGCQIWTGTSRSGQQVTDSQNYNGSATYQSAFTTLTTTGGSGLAVWFNSGSTCYFSADNANGSNSVHLSIYGYVVPY